MDFVILALSSLVVFISSSSVGARQQEFHKRIRQFGADNNRAVSNPVGVASAQGSLISFSAKGGSCSGELSGASGVTMGVCSLEDGSGGNSYICN